MTRTGALRIVRLSAPYDLLVTAPLALPWTAALVLTGLAGAHTGLGLDGVAPDPSNVYVVLFASLVGSLVTVWALVRLWRPTEEDVRRLRFLRRGQELGFRLSELGALVEMSDDARSGIRVTSEMRVRGREKLAEIDERIADLRRMRTALGDVLAAQRLDPAVPRPVVGALA